MPTIHTPFGPIEALPGVERHPGGAVRSCIAARACPLDTPFGTLVPQFTANTPRRRQLPAISFHRNGMPRTLPLEEQTLVATPLGMLPAEQVTLHDSGALKRIFPLNGTLSGYWTQEDEASLARTLSVDTSIGTVERLFIGLCFTAQGDLRSLTLWPGQTVDVPSPVGAVTARIGISFYDSGAIRCLEPAGPTLVPTPVGGLLAFDPDAVGVCGDANSLRFHENGSLLGLVTAAHAFDVTLENGRVRRVAPPVRRHPCDGERLEAAPLRLEFGSGRVCLHGDGSGRIIAPAEGVSPSPFVLSLSLLSPLCAMGAGRW